MALLLTGFGYTLLGALYIAWNSVELKNMRDSKTEYELNRLRRAIQLNYISIVVALALLAGSLFTTNTLVLRILFSVWFIYWTYVLGHYVRINRLFGSA